MTAAHDTTICPSCTGAGGHDSHGSRIRCQTCDGKGYVKAETAPAPVNLAPVWHAARALARGNGVSICGGCHDLHWRGGGKCPLCAAVYAGVYGRPLADPAQADAYAIGVAAREAALARGGAA